MSGAVCARSSSDRASRQRASTVAESPARLRLQPLRVVAADRRRGARRPTARRARPRTGAARCVVCERRRPSAPRATRAGQRRVVGVGSVLGARSRSSSARERLGVAAKMRAAGRQQRPALRRLARLATALVRNASASASELGAARRVAMRGVHQRQRAAGPPGGSSPRRSDADRRRVTHLAVLPRRLEADASARTPRSGNAESTSCQSEPAIVTCVIARPSSEQEVPLRQRQHRRRLAAQHLAVGA